MAITLGISRQWLYKTDFLQVSKDECLKGQILAVLTHQPSYGHRRIAIELGVGKKRVRRVMRAYGIKPYKRKARWRKRRDERRKPAPFSNQIKSQCPLTPNHTWVGDFTYLRFRSKFLYLATFMDLFTREIVGWHLSTSHTKSLVLQAFFDGLANRDFQKPTFIHSDQGVHYTSPKFHKKLANNHLGQSMSRRGNCWDNAPQESFFGHLKDEINYKDCENLEELRAIVDDYIDYYNNQRGQWNLKKLPPVRYREQVLLSAA